jgi:hypothetical protein
VTLSPFDALFEIVASNPYIRALPTTPKLPKSQESGKSQLVSNSSLQASCFWAHLPYPNQAAGSSPNIAPTKLGNPSPGSEATPVNELRTSLTRCKSASELRRRQKTASPFVNSGSQLTACAFSSAQCFSSSKILLAAARSLYLGLSTLRA